METTDEQIEQTQMLIKTIGLPLQLFYNKTQTARIIGLSTVTINRMNEAGIGMESRKVITGAGANGRVLYPISEIARFYFESVKNPNEVRNA